jgi:hypothetical protein
MRAYAPMIQHLAYCPTRHAQSAGRLIVAPQPGDVGYRQIDAVDQDAAAFWHVEPLHQFCQGGYPGTGGTDDADDLPSGNLQGNIRQRERPVDAR